MDLQKARVVSESSATASRAHLALALDWSLRELDKVAAHAAEAERLRVVEAPQWRNAPRLRPGWRGVPAEMLDDGGDDAA